MVGRSIYVHRLGPIIQAEGSVGRMLEKARLAKLNSIWVKVADGAAASPNVLPPVAALFTEFEKKAHADGLTLWGWQVPHCATEQDAIKEAGFFSTLIDEFKLDGAITDTEAGAAYFRGGVKEANVYANTLKSVLKKAGKPMAISSHDIPQNQGQFMDVFNAVASCCDYNFPQVYYGGSPSVENRLKRAEKSNAHLAVPFIPVGAAWISSESDGGCASASACAERAREFIRLVGERGYAGYSFWHWFGAPAAFWEVLNSTA